MMRNNLLTILPATLLLLAGLPVQAVEPGHWQLSGVRVYGPDNAPAWMSVNGTTGVIKMRAEAGGGWLETGVTWSIPENEYADEGKVQIKIEATGDRSEAPLGDYDVLPWFEVVVLDRAPSEHAHDPGTDYAAALSDNKNDVMFILQDEGNRKWNFKKTISTRLPMRYGDHLKSPMYLDFALVPGPGASTDVIYEYTWIDGVAPAAAASSGPFGRLWPPLVLLLVLIYFIFQIRRRFRARKNHPGPSTPAPTRPAVSAATKQSAAPTAPKARFCPNCGTQLEADEAFCPECGTRIGG